jgi:hypothetical protein
MHIFQSGVDFAADEAFRDAFELHKEGNLIPVCTASQALQSKPRSVTIVVEWKWAVTASNDPFSAIGHLGSGLPAWLQSCLRRLTRVRMSK